MNKQRAAGVLERIRQYDQLPRKSTDLVGYIAIVYSCTRAKAKKMIAAAQATSTNPPA